MHVMKQTLESLLSRDIIASARWGFHPTGRREGAGEGGGGGYPILFDSLLLGYSLVF